MFAHVNLPGSSHFETFGPATKAECEAWLDERRAEHQNIHGGVWTSTFSHSGVISNREAKAWKFNDGSRCFKHFDF